MNDETEITLLKAAQAGDIKAMHTLLQPWNNAVFGFLLQSLGRRADAEDAAQETFIRIVRALPAYEHRGEFRAWIFCIARNQAALTANRRKRIETREITVDSQELNAMTQDSEDHESMEKAERAAEIRSAIATLPTAERQVVELRLNEDLKFQEIAIRTSTPLNTVLGRMRNATIKLRIMLEQLHP